MRVVLISISCILVFFLGCHKHDLAVNPQPGSSGIIPLSVGNHWDYNDLDYDSTNTIVYSYVYSFGVIGDSTINGFTWKSVTNYLFANTSNGFCAPGKSNPLLKSDPLLLLKYPAAAQDSFYLSQGAGYVHITSIDTAITITLGTYRCYTYEAHQFWPSSTVEASHQILFVAPQVGLIKALYYASPQISQKEYLSNSVQLIGLALN